MKKLQDLTWEKKIALALFALFFIIIFSFKHSARNTITANVMVGDLEIESSNYHEAEIELTTYYRNLLSQKLNFTYQDSTISLAPSELGFTLNTEKTISDIKELSASNSIIRHWGEVISSLFFTQKLLPILEVEKDTLNYNLEKNFPSLKGEKDAQVNVDNSSRVSVLPHRDGESADQKELTAQITKAIISDEPVEIKITVHPTKAQYRTEQAKKDADQLKSILQHKHTLNYTESVEKVFTSKFLIPTYAVKIKNGEMEFSEDTLEKVIKENIPAGIENEVSNLAIQELPEEGKIFAKSVGLAIDGHHIDYKSTLESLIESLKNGQDTTEISIYVTPSVVINETGKDLGEMKLIAEGHSGFANSALGRKHNIRKGIKERMHGILLEPGAEYSFNANLGTINRANGWEQSLAIFGGDELIPVPGGGLCQVSTTLYRALVGANLEVIEKSNHTLYVLYYEEFGNGLDAAIYPGSKDLKFRNDTSDYIFIQAYTIGDEAFVQIYGTPKHESVELIGPIYSGRVPPQYLKLTDPDWNEISWIQKITHKDGEIEENVLMSRYNSKPRKLYPYKEPSNNE